MAGAFSVTHKHSRTHDTTATAKTIRFLCYFSLTVSFLLFFFFLHFGFASKIGHSVQLTLGAFRAFARLGVTRGSVTTCTAYFTQLFVQQRNGLTNILIKRATFVRCQWNGQVEGEERRPTEPEKWMEIEIICTHLTQSAHSAHCSPFIIRLFLVLSWQNYSLRHALDCRERTHTHMPFENNPTRNDERKKKKKVQYHCDAKQSLQYFIILILDLC